MFIFRYYLFTFFPNLSLQVISIMLVQKKVSEKYLVVSHLRNLSKCLQFTQSQHYCSKIKRLSGGYSDLGKSSPEVLRRLNLGSFQAIKGREASETLSVLNKFISPNLLSMPRIEIPSHLHCKTIHSVQLLPGDHHQGRLASHLGQSQQG